MLEWLEDVKQVGVIAEWSMGPALYIGRVGAECVSVSASKIASATLLAEH
jgi:hypothetical protein